MSTTDRENELRAMAQSEAFYQLEDHDLMGIFETQGEYDLDLTDDEADYVLYLIRRATPQLPDMTLEEYTA